jgi:hypothetical protein
MGNEGQGGLQTGGSPGSSPGAITIGSADSAYTLKYFIIAPDGHQIFYDAGTQFGQWKSIFNSPIVVNSQLSFCLLYQIIFP